MRWIAALGGALLFGALFAPWYRYDMERALREAHPPPSPAAVAATAGVAVVILRIAEHAGPDGFGGQSVYPSPAVGAWLALAGALVAAAAGWAATRRPS